LFAYDFINAFFINLDAQSGLVMLFGPFYSVVMIPFWLLALLLSKRRYVAMEETEQSGS